jgi:hypothetical protein
VRAEKEKIETFLESEGYCMSRGGVASDLLEERIAASVQEMKEMEKQGQKDMTKFAREEEYFEKTIRELRETLARLKLGDGGGRGGTKSIDGEEDDCTTPVEEKDLI